VVKNEALGAAFVIEGEDAPFPDVGFTLLVLQPDRRAGITARPTRRTSSFSLASACC
jgi:hypothetical protein